MSLQQHNMMYIAAKIIYFSLKRESVPFATASGGTSLKQHQGDTIGRPCDLCSRQRPPREFKSCGIFATGAYRTIDIFSAEFPLQFSEFAQAASKFILKESRRAGVNQPQVCCPINEISFWSWVGGDEKHFHPFGSGRGSELKQQLIFASLAAINAVRVVRTGFRDERLYRSASPTYSCCSGEVCCAAA
jgi:hypothetical protein